MKIQSLILFFTLVTCALAFCPKIYAGQSLSAAQIKQIEDIAEAIAEQHNANSEALLLSDNMTVSTHAVAISRNVQITNVLRVKRGLSTSELKQFSDELRREVLPNACAQNANNPAFDRGLFYTFIYKNTYGEKLAEIVVSKETCK